MADDVLIGSLRGGQNDTDAPTALAEDQCVLAENVEFFSSALGERRNGCGPLDITGSTLDTQTAITHLSQWFPANNVLVPEFIAISAVPGTSAVIAKRTNGVWSAIAPVDALGVTIPDIYEVVTQSLNGKLFIAYHSAQDRLHVWDGTTLRRAGLAQPAPPTAANFGAGSYSHVRYFRQRNVIKSGTGVILARSEPSTTLTFTPSGSGSAARITKSATLEAETHWEVEGSEDNILFYRIASLAIATSTYDDTVSLSNTMTATAVIAHPGYVQLSDKAATKNLGGAISNGTYSDGTTFALRGWVGYNGAGAHIAEGAWTNPLTAGDVYFASQDVALACEAAAGIATNYADVGVLSEDVGEYTLLPSARFLGVDGDRLIFAGHWTDLSKQSQVGWTAVFNDPGVGNDERLPASVNNTVNLDNYDKGPITGLGASENGSWYVFKYVGIFKMVRTGDATRAYDVLPISKSRGALKGSIIKGVDENGTGCFYFLDPRLGPSRLGSGGLQTIVGLRTTWGRVNLNGGSVVTRGCFYPFKQQVKWWVAVDGGDRPSLLLTLQVNELRPLAVAGINGIGRGWSTATGRITQATAVAVLTEVVNINGVTSVSERPFIGLTGPDFIQRCDTLSADAGVTYKATIRTRPYLVAGLLNRWGAMTGALLATANASASVVVKLIRDLNLETASVTTALSATSTETHVVKRLDNLALSNATLLQVEFSDP